MKVFAKGPLIVVNRVSLYLSVVPISLVVVYFTTGFDFISYLLLKIIQSTGVLIKSKRPSNLIVTGNVIGVTGQTLVINANISPGPLHINQFLCTITSDQHVVPSNVTGYP
jgi:hypothetical protein